MYEVVHAALDKVTPDGKVRGELEREIGALHRVETHAAERRLALTAALDALDDGGVDAAGATRARTKMSARSARRAADTATQLARMPRTWPIIRIREIPSHSPTMVYLEGGSGGLAAARCLVVGAQGWTPWAGMAASDAAPLRCFASSNACSKMPPSIPSTMRPYMEMNRR